MGKEKILVRPLFNYNIDFKKLLFFLQVPLSFLLQVIFVYKTKRGEVVLLRSSAVLVDYACKQFLISFQRNGGTEDKKKINERKNNLLRSSGVSGGAGSPA